MKKVILIASFVAGATALNAQHVEPGIKAGLNISTIRVGNSSATYDPRISAHFGGLAHIHLTKTWALQPEVVYSLQGYKADVTGGDATYRMNYLNVPVLVQYMFGTGFRLETGPQVGFLTSAKRIIGSTTVDVKNNYKEIDLSWGFGAGYVSRSGLGLDARFNLGISKINDNPGSDVRQGVFQVGVFYQFRPVKH